MESRPSDIAINKSQETGLDAHTQNNTAPAAPLPPGHPLPAPNQRCLRAEHFKYGYYLLPIASAGLEAAQTALGLLNDSPAIVIPAAICNFGAALGINTKFTVDGIEDSYVIFKNRKLPEDWCPLTRTQDIATATISWTLAAYASFSDGVLGYFYMMEIPELYSFTNKVNMTGWSVLSGVTGGLYGLNILAGEGMATYKKAREIVGGVRPEYSNTFSSYVSPTVGGALGIFGSIADSIDSFTGMRYVFNITSLPASIAIGGLSAINGVTDYAMNGLFVVECLDIFFGAFTPAEGEQPVYRDPKIIAAFILSIAAGGLLAYTWRCLASEMLLEAATAVGLEIPAITGPAIEILACGGATSNFVNSAGSIFPFFHKFADKVGDAASYVYTKVSSCLHDPQDDNNEFLDDPSCHETAISIDELLTSDEENDSLLSSESNPNPAQDHVVIDMQHLPAQAEDDSLVAPAERHNSLLFRLFSQPINYSKSAATPTANNNNPNPC